MSLKEQQSGIDSLEVGLAVAKVLADSTEGALTLGEIATRIGIAPAKAHRYLVSLRRADLVQRNITSGKFELGWAAIRLGLAVQSRLDPVQVASRAIEKLHVESGLPISLAIWTENGPLIIRKAESRAPFLIGSPVGTTVPVLNSSNGRVFATFLPESRVKPLIDAELAAGIRPRSGGKAIPLSRISELLNEVREQGFALQRDDLVAGLQAIAAPVFDASGALTMSVAMLSLSQDRDFAAGMHWSQTLIETAQEISRHLGHVRGREAAR